MAQSFLNTSVNEKGISNKTVLIIINNFVLHKTTVCNDKDSPWYNNKIKTIIQAKYTVFNSFGKNSCNFDLKRDLESLQECLNGSIESSKITLITMA